TDLKWWTGWSLRDTRAALGMCDAVAVDVDGSTGFVLSDDLDPVAPPDPWVALLPALDPTPMGWKERDWFVGDYAAALFDRNGNIGPTVWCDGRIVGGWAQAPNGEVVVEFLEKVGGDRASLVEHEQNCLAEWLGDDRITPRFRTPLDRKIVA
ncbi:MAG: winged helix DNA-binding domain-containing protein, partial [Acidimicrobiia bacterium]|nr:winged helix DNA-binding domain-containing protein [Acidimicrobiia bacterium]